MYKLCKTEQSYLRQRELENRFLDYLETESFFDIEVSGLCRFLNIPRKTFYRYFGSCEDALYALVDHRLQDMNQHLLPSNASADSQLLMDLQHFFAFWNEQRRFLNILTQNYLGIVLMSRAMLLHNLSPRLADYVSGSKDPGAAYKVDFMVSGIMSILFRWQQSGYAETPEQLTSISLSLFRNSMMEILDYSD